MGDSHHEGRNCKIERAYPVFLGRMANIMKTNASPSANRLLSDEPHLYDSNVLIRNSDISRISVSGLRKTASEFKETYSNGESCGVPVKMLIAQEMSIEVESRGSQPSLVAKLMGLDPLPMVGLDSPARKTCSRSHRSSVSCGDQQSILAGSVDANASKDVYETWQQSRKLPCRGKFEETENDKRMALVREKFSEAKRLSMDGKLHQSKQFQDALEVLSSNKDLFIKCLQEPHSIFSEHLNGWLSIPPPADTRRITVLLPSKVAENHNYSFAADKDGKQVKKDAIFNRNSLETVCPGSPCSAGFKYCENSNQRTRIVVLKPSPGKLNGAKAFGSPQFETSGKLCDKVLFGDVEDSQNKGCREDAKPTEDHIHSNLRGLNRDENLIPSVFCNGHISNDNSFLPDDNPRGSEVMSPVSRHSWDCVNTLGSPYSISYSDASYSPDTSVFREVKKRLFERWVATASDDTCQGRKHAQRSSKSLGEMLALSEKKMAAAPEEGSSCSKEVKDSKAQSVHHIKREKYVDESPRDLVRSKSVPVGTGLDLGISVFHKGMQDSGEEDANSKAAKLSFKGMVSGLFSSRSKISGTEKTFASESKGDASSSVPEELHIATESHTCKPLDKALPSSEASSSALIGNMSSEFTAKPVVCGRPGENQDQPRPVSVLDPHFGDECIARGVPQCIKSNQRGAKLSLNFRGSSAIGKSPAIGTIPRTLCWDELYAETAPAHPVGECLATQRSGDEELDWVVFAKALLSVSGLQDQVLSNLCPERWHSHESPLDPSLRDKYIDLKDNEMIHEVKRKRNRSTRKLVFDCVNAALVETAGSWLEAEGDAIPCNLEKNATTENASLTLVDKVWSLLNSWFSDEAQRRISDNGEEEDIMNVDSVVKDEVAGWRWSDELRMEMNHLKKDIAGGLLDDLMYEAVIEFASRIRPSVGEIFGHSR